MQLDRKIEVNKQRIISETLDGETILINLESGAYYSMNETGSIIWEDIQAGYSTGKIIEHIKNTYDIEEGRIPTAIAEFMKFLETDMLILESDAVSDISVPAPLTTKKVFIIPKIDKYEDMQEMLLADPIHDVDTTGWPKRKEV